MSIFTQWQELKQITGHCMANAGTPDDGNAIMGGTTVSRAETLQDFPVRAGASAVRFLFENARINFGTTANQSDMETSANAQRRISGTGSGSFVSLASAVSVPKGVTVLTDPVALTVSAGEELTVACYGKSMTAGKYMSATRQLIARGLGAVGDTLTFDGTGAVSGDYFEDDGWCPGLILGKTRAKGLGAFGHSLIVARLNFGFSGACIGADRLGIPFAAFGLGGSLLTAWNSSANFDIAALIGRNLIIHGMVNATNNFANDATLNAVTGSSIPTYSGGTWTTSMADQLRDKVRRIAAFGIRVFVVTENFPGTAASARKLETWHYWNEWLVNSAAAYCGAALAGVIDTRPYFADTPYINGTPLASSADGPASDDIHSNWEHFGSAIEDAFKSGGPFNSYLTPDENNLVEANVETFYGASGTPGAAGALPSGWVEWYYSPTESPRLAINGTGALKVVSPTFKTTYALWNTAIGGSDAAKTCVIRAVSAPWVAQADGQGLGIHLHSVGGTAVDNTTHAAGGAREGYYLRISNTTTQLNVNRQRFNSVNDQSTYSVGSSVIGNVTGYAGEALAAGDILSVEVTRTYDAGTGNNTFTVLVYKNGILLTPSSGLSTWTDTVTTAPFQGNLYASVGTTGNTATTHTSGSPTWDYVQIGNYDATVVDSVTGPATAYVARGGSEPIEVSVTQSAPTVGPAVGVTVTASVASLTGATIGAAATTDGTGVARFSEGSALTIPDSLSVGETGTVTFVCGGVSEVTPVEVIENAGSGTGGVFAVVVTPAGASIAASATVDFNASVTGDPTPGQSVTWSVVGGSGNGTINSSGLYTAPATPGTYTVRAVSVDDTDKSTDVLVFVTGGEDVVLRQGPWRLQAEAPSDPATIAVTVGDSFAHVFGLYDGRGVAVPINSSTLEVSVVSLTGTVLYDAETPDSTADERLTWTPSTPWATAGTYRLSVRLTDGDGGISTFTGVVVEVKAL